MLSRRGCSLSARARGFSTAGRLFLGRDVSASGLVHPFTATPKDLVQDFELLPRDCRLLQTRSAHIAVRESYFLFRFPPFTGAVRHDRVILISNGSSPAAEALQQRVLATIEGDAQDGDASTPFEHRVLEAVLHEDTMHKRDKYIRLEQLIRASTLPADPPGKMSWLLNTSRESALYRMITLSRALGALALEVKRSNSALQALLANDEDMAGTYLSSREATGIKRSVDDHIDVELLLENFATEHEDLGDRIEALQEAINSHRIIESLKLTNERNRIMRLELLVGFGSASLAMCAAAAGFFGMNLHSGVEDIRHGLWLVSGTVSVVASAVFTGFVLSVRRFNKSQQQQVLRTSALERSLASLDTAYFALRQRWIGTPNDDEESSQPVHISLDALRHALDESGKGPVPTEEVEELYNLLDANGDGVLTVAELGISEKEARRKVEEARRLESLL
jgi:hypothetical protein